MVKKLIFYIFLIGILSTSVQKSYAQFYYGSQMDFGKNRVQYNEFLWSVYHFDKYDIYFYLNGKPLAVYAAKAIQKNFEEIQNRLDYSLDDKLQFIIYNKQTDYKQSNLGLQTTTSYNIGGVTRTIGTKIILYYDGDHENFEKQIKAGLAEICINQLLFGGSLKEMARSAAFLNVPEWYSKGLSSWMSYKMDFETDNQIKNLILSNKFKQLGRMSGQDATIAGHALWYYVTENYGKNVVPNILYMSKISRSIESGFLFVIGVSLKTLLRDCENFYRKRYENQKLSNVTVPDLYDVKTNAKRIYSQVKLSPDGTKIAYVSNELGQYKVFIYDLVKKKRKRILKAEKKLNRTIDKTYPLLAWHPTGERLTYFTEQKGKLWINNYELEKGKREKRELFNFEKVIDFSYSHDGKKYVFSAVQNGFTDIFVYNVGSNSVEQITKDVYDDITPRFIQQSSNIVFSSNRTNDTIRFQPDKIELVQKGYDLFEYNYKSKSNVLIRLTETPVISETNPIEYDKDHIAFLSDYNGVKNVFVASFDSVVSFVDTAIHYRNTMKYFPVSNNYYSELEHDINGGKYATLTLANQKYKIQYQPLQPFESLTPVTLENTTYRNTIKTNSPNIDFSKKNKEEKKKNRSENPKQNSPEKPRITNPNEIDIDFYEFENEKQNKEKAKLQTVKPDTLKPVATDTSKTNKLQSLKEKPEEEFKLPKQLNYNKYFMADYFVSQLDNSFLSASYQRFQPGTPFYNPGFNGLFKVGISDLFENDRITGGVRLASNFKSNEFFAGYEMLEKRLDKQLIFHRQTIESGNGAFNYKIFTHEAKYLLKYPFNEVASLRGTFTARNDRYVFSADTESGLKKGNNYTSWGIAKLEYVFDNTLPIALNIMKGTRFKLFAEYYNQVVDYEKNTAIVGMDLRNYIRIHRELIWANRFAASTNFGQEKLIYYMGGVDNWLLPKFDNSVRIDYSQNYTFQTIATNMRGFQQNARNGNTFAVINSELRWPIFRYLTSKPIKSEFINNFQIIGFGDIGTAWSGLSPYSDENTLFTKIIAPPGSPIEIIIKTKEEPIIGGYGWGLRSKLFGYFVRCDWAWGVQDGVVKPRVFYISLNLDF